MMTMMTDMVLKVPKQYQICEKEFGLYSAFRIIIAIGIVYVGMLTHHLAPSGSQPFRQQHRVCTCPNRAQ
jgi:hypothetical protein